MYIDSRTLQALFLIFVPVAGACYQGFESSGGEELSTSGAPSASAGPASGPSGDASTGSSSGPSTGDGDGSSGSSGTGGPSNGKELPDETCPSDPLVVDVGEGAAEVFTTFHSMSVYWRPNGGGSNEPCTVHYRRRGACNWHTARPLWFDDTEHVNNLVGHENEYRGSLLNLLPGRTYEVRLELEGGAATSVEATTMPEEFPIARVVELTGSTTEKLLIDEGGSADEGYVLYTGGDGGYTIDTQKQTEETVLVTAPYVILRNLAIRGGGKNGITIQADHVVIENSDIADWGSQVPEDGDRPGYGSKNEGAIYAWGSENHHIVIQRNRIHDPTYTANSWQTAELGRSHPFGPIAISFRGTSGHHIIRYNEATGSGEHMYDDTFGGGQSSFDAVGFPGRDSDVYGNIVSHAWDDAIETDGWQLNTRVWGNFIDQSFVAISAASVALGPLYILRNVVGESNFSNYGEYDERTGDLLKLGKPVEHIDYTHGPIVLAHNTTTQPIVDGEPEGVQNGVYYSPGGTKYQDHVYTRNNLIHLRASSGTAIRNQVGGNPTNDFDWDMSNGTWPSELEPNGLEGVVPVYEPNQGPHEFVLAAESPGHDEGTVLPGINADSYVGDAPDMGAFERGGPELEFGVAADWTSWAEWIDAAQLAEE